MRASSQPLSGPRAMAPRVSSGSMLIEHHEALDSVAAVVDAARGGLSGVLVLRGPAGNGESSLLERAVDSVPDFHVARAAGVASEMDLSFAGLHQLVRPYLSGL